MLQIRQSFKVYGRLPTLNYEVVGYYMIKFDNIKILVGDIRVYNQIPFENQQ